MHSLFYPQYIFAKKILYYSDYYNSYKSYYIEVPFWEPLEVRYLALLRYLVEEIYQLILETVQTEKDMIRIAGEYYPAGFVKGKLLKLNYSHIEYVLECMDKNTTKVRNIKQYLLAALFNAPSTIGSYYKAAVNHDMPQYAN